MTTGQRLVTGDVVNTAARLEQAAPANDVLLGDSTYRLVRDAVEVEAVEPLELKGKAERVPAYRLISIREGEAVTRHLERPIVGRQHELAELDEALSTAIAEKRPQLVTVLGSAGVGKSRLLEEYLRRSAGRADKVAGHCLNYGEGITFWPLAEIAKGAAGILNDDDAAGDRQAAGRPARRRRPRGRPRGLGNRPFECVTTAWRSSSGARLGSSSSSPPNAP